MRAIAAAAIELPTLNLKSVKQWEAWLARHHASRGVWLRMTKKAPGVPPIPYGDVLDVALCWGWIDGTRRGESETAFLQKFVPRARRSTWSKINREKALALIKAGRMAPAGLAEVERAKQDGRWDAAYDGPRSASVPSDLQTALDASPKAKADFATLDSRNRFAILFRLHQAKKPETRARRLVGFVRMLERGERIYPPAARRVKKI